MPTVLLGLVAVLLILWGLHILRTADPRKVAPALKKGAGGAALVGGLILSARGMFGLGIPLGIAGLGLLGWIPGLPATLGERRDKSAGQVSQVRTAFVEMELDHDTGAMQGRILAGPYEGVTLDALAVPTLVRLLGDIDEESRALLATYLDRREPRWRENAQGSADAGRGSFADGGPMTPEEAYQVL